MSWQKAVVSSLRSGMYLYIIVTGGVVASATTLLVQRSADDSSRNPLTRSGQGRRRRRAGVDTDDCVPVADPYQQLTHSMRCRQVAELWSATASRLRLNLAKKSTSHPA